MLTHIYGQGYLTCNGQAVGIILCVLSTIRMRHHSLHYRIAIQLEHWIYVIDWLRRDNASYSLGQLFLAGRWQFFEDRFVEIMELYDMILKELLAIGTKEAEGKVLQL